MSKQKIRDSSEENICYILWTKVGDTSGKEPACLCRRCKRCGFDLVDQEDPLEKKMAAHSTILTWRIPRIEKPGRLRSTGSQRV